MKKVALALTCFGLMNVAATGPALADDTYTILEVNGEKIPNTEAEEAWKSLFPNDKAPKFEGFDEEVRQNVLRGLISERLLYNEAQNAGIHERDDISVRLKNLKKQITIQAYIEELSDSFVTKAALEKAYAQYAEKAKEEEEVRARHILLASKEKAQEVLKKLDAGKDFASLAKSMSTDKGSAARGGDLDYFTKDKMVAEFSDAAFDLKPGEYSNPVRSGFGWHIIKVEDRRAVKVKSFTQMQETLKAEVRSKGVDRYVDQLMSNAKVSYYSPSGKRKNLDIQ